MHPAVARTVTEKEFQQAVMNQLKEHGWMAYHTWNSRRSAPGFPDVVAVKGGRLLMVELKKEGEDPDSNQQEWLDRLGQVPGIISGVWRPGDWDEILAILEGK